VLRSDIGAVIGFIDKKYPGAGLVLAGESMGGLIAVDYASWGERPLAGLVLLAPAFAVHPDVLKLKLDIKKVFDELAHGVDLTMSERLDPSTRDKGFIEARRKDKLAYRKVPPTTYLGKILVMQGDLPATVAEIKVPTFVAVSKARWMWAAAAVGWAGARTSRAVSFKTFRMDLQRSE